VLCEGQNCLIVYEVTNICKLSLCYTWGHELWCSGGGGGGGGGVGKNGKLGGGGGGVKKKF